MINRIGSLRLDFSRPFIRVSLCVLTIISFFLFTKIFDVNAASVATAVTVGNSGPTFTSGPAESTESSSTNPTNVGSAVTFQATGTDSNSENYYLIICSTNSITPHNGTTPTCGGTTWCTSNATASGSQATCSHTAVIGDATSNV